MWGAHYVADCIRQDQSLSVDDVAEVMSWVVLVHVGGCTKNYARGPQLAGTPVQDCLSHSLIGGVSSGESGSH